MRASYQNIAFVGNTPDTLLFAASPIAPLDTKQPDASILVKMEAQPMSSGSRLDEWTKFRTEMNERILSGGNTVTKRFFSLDTQTYAEGAIDPFAKELMGLAASTVLRCDDCIAYHLNECHKLGMTEDQFWEAMNVGLIVGGSIVIPHLRRAVAFWDELNGRQKAKG